MNANTLLTFYEMKVDKSHSYHFEITLLTSYEGKSGKRYENEMISIFMHMCRTALTNYQCNSSI